MTKTRRILAAAALATLLIPFQNCGSKTDLGAYGVSQSSSGTSKLEVVASYNPVSVAPFQATTLAVTAKGTGTLTYQWFKDGVVIPGETGPALPLSELNVTPLTAATSTYTYKVTVTDGSGNQTSLDLPLEVKKTAAQLAPPTVTLPGNFQRPTCAGNSNQGNTLPIVATATGTRLTYSWKIAYSGLTDNLTTNGPALNPPVIPVANGVGQIVCRVMFFGTYTVTVTDAFGQTATASVAVASNNF